MVPRALLIAVIFAVSAYAEVDITGNYENLTPDVYDYGSGLPDEGSGSGSGFDSGNDQDLSIDMDCSNKEDGLYQIAACSTQFLTCSGGIARIMDCPANLIYDTRIEACEYPANVPGCPGADVPQTTEEPITTTQEPETTTLGYVEPSTLADEPATSQRAAADRECHEDGFFSYGECSDHYTACSNGRSIPMMCPASLAFDEARQLCDYPLAVPECQGSSGEEATTEESSGDLPYDNGYGYEEPSSSTEADVPVVIPEETTTEQVYPEETTTEAVPVYPEETTTEAAPAYLEERTTEAVPVYPEETTTEAYPVDPEETTTEEAPVVPEETTTVEIPVYPEETTTESLPVVHEPGNDTPSCVEGATEISPCSQLYNNCVNGKEALFTCENGLRFSQSLGSCAPEDQLPECQTQEGGDNY